MSQTAPDDPQLLQPSSLTAQVPARQYPVTIHFSRRTEMHDYVGAAFRKVGEASWRPAWGSGASRQECMTDRVRPLHRFAAYMASCIPTPSPLPSLTTPQRLTLSCLCSTPGPGLPVLATRIVCTGVPHPPRAAPRRRAGVHDWPARGGAPGGQAALLSRQAQGRGAGRRAPLCW